MSRTIDLTRLDEFITQSLVTSRTNSDDISPSGAPSYRSMLIKLVKGGQPTPFSAISEDIVLTEEVTQTFVRNESLQRLRIRNGACRLRACPRLR